MGPEQHAVRVAASDLAALSRRLRREGKVVVFTNGCFDLVHAGHVKLLQTAKALGDVLVVGVNSDRSVRTLKGEGRPVLPLRDRIAVLSAFACVDYVVVFDARTPVRLIRKLKPHVHVKGGDYRKEALPERSAVLEGGGRIVLVPLLPKRSTTRLLSRLTDLKRSGEHLCGEK